MEITDWQTNIYTVFKLIAVLIKAWTEEACCTFVSLHPRDALQ